MKSYYNEFDPFAAQWLRNLISAGHVAPGDVDERPIQEVTPSDLRGYTQAHFFAGIGGWSYALRLAGWPDDRPAWTGSCPCQPFSAAGKRKGTADERHLWPWFDRLIAECEPPVVFGEQVASKDGRQWLSGVRADLEALGYAVGAADLCAAGAGAPHIRQRLFWVADADSAGRGKPWGAGADEPTHVAAERFGEVNTGVDDVRVLRGFFLQSAWGACRRLPVPARRRVGPDGPVFEPPASFRIGPCAGPLADGPAAYVGRLRGYGNTIVPQVAAAFIAAYRECRP